MLKKKEKKVTHVQYLLNLMKQRKCFQPGHKSRRPQAPRKGEPTLHPRKVSGLEPRAASSLAGEVGYPEPARMLPPHSQAGNVAIARLAAVHDDLHLGLLRGPVASGDAGGQGALGGGGEGLGQRAGCVLGAGGASPLQRRVPRLPRVVVVRAVLLRHPTHLQGAQEPLQPQWRR